MFRYLCALSIAIAFSGPALADDIYWETGNVWRNVKVRTMKVVDNVPYVQLEITSDTTPTTVTSGYYGGMAQIDFGDRPTTATPAAAPARRELSQAQSRAIFAEIVAMEQRVEKETDRLYPSTLGDAIEKQITYRQEETAKGRAAIAARHGITLQQVQEIMAMGIRESWSSLPQQTSSVQAPTAPQQQYTPPRQNTQSVHWLNVSTGVRHNIDCRWFGDTKTGRYCRPTEGRACQQCGG